MSLWLATLRTTGAWLPGARFTAGRMPTAIEEAMGAGMRSVLLRRGVKQNAVRNTPIVIYRGPQPMKSWIYYTIGTSFLVVGAELAYDFYYHLTWPVFSQDPTNPPQLVGEGKRGIAAGLAGSAGILTALLFFSVPARAVTKLSLDVAKRQLTIRTASRGLSALFPRAIYPSPLRKTAELRGFYQTRRNNERVVPLSLVYRLRGSAMAASLGKNKLVRTDRGDVHVGIQHRRDIIFKVGDEKLWYVLESAGGAKPDSRGYKGFWRKFSHSLRGKTNWEGMPLEKRSEQLSSSSHHSKAESRILGEKEPWFLDRRAFDDILPFVVRR